MGRKPRRGHRYIDRAENHYRYSKPFRGSHGTYRVRIFSRRTGELVKTVTTRQTSFPAAEAKREDIIKEWENRSDEPTGPVTFAQAARDWLATKELEVRAPTLRDYRSVVQQFLTPHLGDEPLSEITRADLRRIIMSDKRSQSRRRTRRIVALAIFAYAADKGWHSGDNPARGIKIAATPQKPKVLLTDPEAATLVDLAGRQWEVECTGRRQGGGAAQWIQSYAPPPCLRLALILALRQGLRLRTLLDLRWRNVRLSERRLEFHGDQMKGGREFHIPLHPDTERLLTEELHRQGAIVPNGRVLREFSQDQGDFRRSLRNLTGRLSPRVEDPVRRAEIRRLSPHHMRHHFASALATFAPAAVLAALLDHRPTTALQVTGIYTHIPWESLVEAIGRLPSLLGEQKAVNPESPLTVFVNALK